ncbi:NfeD family protein [Planktothrix sp. FACHB-1355]|uniref:NfeD family protein n=1 Tax=Aerosakkonema funiforme FACHB-1375 TaxID=2949571 RepID=A0A926ZJZ5_9CYAN|nr:MULTISPECIES: NfeD family protein [Oscillatoriales]MBD2186098.1 NfeD family protein [Aerosakkonema funiforme FACHB-1375]MBD3561134.1 NfeD family protein [Planktothrix sp. FACHB-1355]
MKSLFIPSEVEVFPEPVIGTVDKVISPQKPGRVRCLGSCWPAQLYQVNCQATILPEESVNIVAIQGITLLVVPLISHCSS